MGRSSEPDKIQQGWDMFERWARTFERSCTKQTSSPTLWNHFEISDIREKYFADDAAVQLSHEEKKLRIAETIGFFRGYFVDVSFDQGPSFDCRVKALLKNHNNRNWRLGYNVYIYTNDIENAPSGASWHFSGFNVGLFCDKLNHIDFASVMSVLPFDRIIIRNRRGQKWSDEEINKVVYDIEKDLEFDGLGIGLAVDFFEDDLLFIHSKRPWRWGSSKSKSGRTVMAHEVGMEFPKIKALGGSDVVFSVSNSAGKLGELRISRGNIEWIPFKKQIKRKRMSWEKFAEFMSGNQVKTVRNRRPRQN